MAKEWVTVEVSLDPLLELVQPVLDPIESVLEFLIAVLNIVQTILNVIKAFLVGLLDPIRALVELIIEEVRNLIQDLRQLGVYITGDWKLINPDNKHNFLLGGYQAYERRMMARLLDTNDPNRPDFTSSSTVVGAFFYTSSGDITEIIRVVRALLKFFGQGDLMGKSMPFATPTTPTVKYGSGAAGAASFKQLSQSIQSAIPDAVTLNWSMPAGGGMGTSYGAAPAGFLIHVSTIPDGLQVIGSAPKSDLASETENLPRVISAGIDPLTNGAMKLYGGLSDIYTEKENFGDVSPAEGEDLDPHAPLLLLQKDSNTPLIKLGTLLPPTGSSVPLLANTYFVETSLLTKLGAGTQFSAILRREDLPLHATFEAGSDGFAEVKGSAQEADTYYFRVRAVNKDYVDRFGGIKATLANPVNVYPYVIRPYWVPRASILQSTNGILLPLSASSDNPGIGWPSMTPASGPAQAKFPTENQAEYINAVLAAVAAAILVRADLTEGNLLPPVEDTGIGIDIPITGTFKKNTYTNTQATGLEGAARDILARYGFSPVWYRGSRPQAFRLKVKNLLLRISSDLQTAAAPPETVAKAVIDGAKNLLAFKWSDYDHLLPSLTILESVGITSSTTDTSASSEASGVGGNPFCRSLPESEIAFRYRYGKGPPREPYFDVSPRELQTQETFPGWWTMGGGSGDLSPIVYADPSNEFDPEGKLLTISPITTVYFARYVLMDHDSKVVLDEAAAVLQLAASSVSRPVGDTGWIALRLMPNAIPQADQLLEKLDRFLQGILDGLDGIIDKIVAYIEAIQARIYQFQALLQWIESLLQSLDLFRLPSMSALVLVESGTDGLVTGLLTSENKPSDTSLSYGSGVLVVSGGLPTVLLEILALILSGGES